MMNPSATMPQPRDKAHWTLLTISMNALHSLLAEKPVVFRAERRYGAPGGTLDAYREGDLSFDEAVAELAAWKASL